MFSALTLTTLLFLAVNVVSIPAPVLPPLGTIVLAKPVQTEGQPILDPTGAQRRHPHIVVGHEGSHTLHLAPVSHTYHAGFEPNIPSDLIHQGGTGHSSASGEALSGSVHVGHVTADVRHVVHDSRFTHNPVKNHNVDAINDAKQKVHEDAHRSAAAEHKEAILAHQEAKKIHRDEMKKYATSSDEYRHHYDRVHKHNDAIKHHEKKETDHLHYASEKGPSHDHSLHEATLSKLKAKQSTHKADASYNSAKMLHHERKGNKDKASHYLAKAADHNVSTAHLKAAISHHKAATAHHDAARAHYNTADKHGNTTTAHANSLKAAQDHTKQGIDHSAQAKAHINQASFSNRLPHDRNHASATIGSMKHAKISSKTARNSAKDAKHSQKHA